MALVSSVLIVAAICGAAALVLGVLEVRYQLAQRKARRRG